MGRYRYDSVATHKCNWVIIDARAGNMYLVDINHPPSTLLKDQHCH
jgi:hypothetical protein